MDILCQQMLSSGTKCNKRATFVCKFEGMLLCVDCYFSYHDEASHEKIFDNISLKIVESGSQICNFTCESIQNILQNLNERKNIINKTIPEDLDSKQKITDLTESSLDFLCRPEYKNKIFKAIKKYFSMNDESSNDKIVKDFFQNLNHSINQGNEELKKISEEISEKISKFRDKNTKKNTKFKEAIKQLKNDREEMKNEINGLKVSLIQADAENKNLKEEIKNQIKKLKESKKKSIQKLKEHFENKTSKLISSNIWDQPDLKQKKFLLKLNQDLNELRLRLEENQKRIDTFDLEYIQSSINKVQGLEENKEFKKEVAKMILFVNDIRLIFNQKCEESKRSLFIEAIQKFREKNEFKLVFGIKISEDDKVFICKE